MIKHVFSQLGESFYSFTQVQPLLEQRLVEFNHQLADELGIDIKDKALKSLLSGKFHDPLSLSMVYAGHQFGGFSPQLGDGRGILLGEIETENGLVDLHLKGAGLTPYSRRGDGRAVLRSCIREYLAAEAMTALGIPSSRSLCLFDSNQAVYRERPEPGAMLLRTAKTHIRFGHFEFFYYRKQMESLQILIDYTIDQYFPHCRAGDNPIKCMLIEIVESTARMIAHWQSVGFQHGVMNTDNMSILGETIDYGPYGFMENYDPRWIANHSDHEGRYTLENQPSVGLWNLNCLMRAFSHHLSKDELIEVLGHYEPELMRQYRLLTYKKLGLTLVDESDESYDVDFVRKLYVLLKKESLDYTLFFRALSNMASPSDYSIILDDVVDRVSMSKWLDLYVDKRQKETVDWNDSKIEMLKINPKFILRNYLAQQVIQEAEQGNYLPFRRLLYVLQAPFSEHVECEDLSLRPPEWAKDLEVSCSS
ncbi:protein adenylyltransferase SelO [Marinomonas algicola]|uniref:protein adenylyltransferase SelO n=1 Tax=Marinomonas algicola TaxID=2773454 RepID=UPI0017481B6D|nr:YdiU family protein [Marinomonas algicola]